MLDTLRFGELSSAAQASILQQLIAMLDDLEGDPHQSVDLCAQLRDQSLVEVIAGCATHHCHEVYSRALRLLTALTTREVDPSGADATLAILRDMNAFPDLVAPHLFSGDAYCLALACGLCQNACLDLELAHALLQSGDGELINRITKLASHAEGHQAVVQAASACLINLDSTTALATRAFDAILRLQRSARSRARMRTGRESGCRRHDIIRAARCLSQCPSPPPSPPCTMDDEAMSVSAAPHLRRVPSSPRLEGARASKALRPDSPRAPATLQWS